MNMTEEQREVMTMALRSEGYNIKCIDIIEKVIRAFNTDSNVGFNK